MAHMPADTEVAELDKDEPVDISRKRQPNRTRGLPGLCRHLWARWDHQKGKLRGAKGQKPGDSDSHRKRPGDTIFDLSVLVTNRAGSTKRASASYSEEEDFVTEGPSLSQDSNQIEHLARHGKSAQPVIWEVDRRMEWWQTRGDESTPLSPGHS